MTPTLVLFVAGCSYQASLNQAAAPEADLILEAPPPPPAVAKRGRGVEEELAELGYVEAEADGAERAPLDLTARGAPGQGWAAADDDPRDRGDRKPQAEAPTRSWFPEAFLWRPLVETGDDGLAEVDVTVPDQLSAFRVLALAHDRRGHQAGALHQFQTRLPVYVDPVVPDRLFAGDRVQLPVQVVNGSSNPLSAQVTVEATGALSGRGTSAVTLSAGGSDVRLIELVAGRSGEARVTAQVQAGEYGDAAERTVVVRPAGRPVVTRTSQRLSAEPFTLEAPSGADRTTERIEVVVFAGPWSVLQSEVERIAAGARTPDPAYGFALSTHIEALAAASGVALDLDRHRRMRVQAWQRLSRQARAPSSGQAVDLLTSLRAVEGDELVDALVPQLTRQVVGSQRADGTWSRADRSTLQQVLVQTAVAARSLPESERGPRVRASGAIERALTNLDDAYTTAVVLASGLVPAEHRPDLQVAVREAVEDGRLGFPGTVRNAQGLVPSIAEALAWAILALEPDDDVAGALVSALLGRWSAERGFGAGPADAVALDAIARALPPQNTALTLTLRRGDDVLATSSIDPAQPKVPGRFVIEPAAASTTLVVTAEPAAPGLVMVATRRSWVPWRSSDRVEGVDVEVRASSLRVGRTGELRFSIAAPSGSVVEVTQALPPGASVDPGPPQSRATLDVFVNALQLTTEAFQPGEIVEVRVPVVPSFAGRFTTDALQVTVDGGPPTPLAPLTWTVSP